MDNISPGQHNYYAVFKHGISKHAPLLLLSGLIVAFGVGGDGAVAGFKFDRSGILAGDIYRLITGHFVHLGWLHSLMNLAAVAVFWGLFRGALTHIQWFFSVLIIGLIISMLLLMDSDVSWYVGFSGVIHGLFFLGAVRERRKAPIICGIALVGLFIKIGIEQFFGPSASTESWIGGDVLIDAHLYGVIAGVLRWMACGKETESAGDG